MMNCACVECFRSGLRGFLLDHNGLDLLQQERSLRTRHSEAERSLRGEGRCLRCAEYSLPALYRSLSASHVRQRAEALRLPPREILRAFGAETFVALVVGRASVYSSEPLSRPLTAAYVLCCICGAVTPPHPKNKCLSCLQEEIDISTYVCRNFVVDHCRQCDRYKDAQGKWLPCQPESRELLALCLKKIRGLKSLSRIIDCRWLFTEVHSNKLLIRITARAEVLDGSAQVEQSFNVQGILHNMQCDDCKKAFTPHAEAEIMRCTASGVPEGELLVTMTHLGHLLQAGDFAAGFDLHRINLSGFADSCVEHNLHWPQANSGNTSGRGGPQQEVGLATAPWPVMLVKKHFPNRKSNRRREWVLRTLQKHEDDGTAMEEESEGTGRLPPRRPAGDSRKRRGGAGRGGAAAAAEDEDMEEFKRDLEEDAELRKQVALYRDPRRATKPAAAGAAKIRISGEKKQKQKQQGQKRREANKARRLAEAQQKAQRNKEQAEGSDSSCHSETDDDQEDEADAGPVVDLSELLEGLTLEDLQPVQLGQGDQGEGVYEEGPHSSDEEDAL
ncbi:putative NMD3 protein [Cyclospora cayetanensis]|uniref:60S ribosomal export protein NMD3 n=1 Tax=Cyclospora cayetanensis TaxID=88456 RepID=A0A1D3CYR4_9EIME|nr:putative NMD3 protein [Cyclospora cayetanensis]